MVKVKVFTYFLILLISTSCATEFTGKKVKEGKVEYEIEYLKKTDNLLVQNLLPKSINLIFDKNNTKTSFKGAFGIYELSYIANKKEDLWSILYQLKRNTYLYQQGLHESKSLINDIDIIEIIELDETKEIANYTCKKIIIKTDLKDFKESTLYYTDKVKFDFPILLNLFGKIDGILMDFELPQADMLLRVTATEIKSAKLADDEFKIPEKAQRIKENMMKNLLNTEL